MNENKFYKNIFFTSHIFGIIFTNFFWIIFPEIIILQLLTIISWKLNNNKCIICQIERYLLGNTFIGNNKIYIKRKYRYILYINFLLTLIFNINKWYLNSKLNVIHVN